MSANPYDFSAQHMAEMIQPEEKDNYLGITCLFTDSGSAIHSFELSTGDAVVEDETDAELTAATRRDESLTPS